MPTDRIFLIVTRSGDVVTTSSKDKRANLIISGNDPQKVRDEYLRRLTQRTIVTPNP